MAHHHAGDEALLAAELVIARGANDLYHGLKRREGHLGVVGSMGVASRQRRIGVLEVGEVGVHEADVAAHRLHGLVAARVPQHRQRHALLARQGNRRADLRREVRRRHAVDVQRPGRLKLAHDGGQALDSDCPGRLAQSDRGVLAINTTQRAAGEEDGAAAVLAGDRRLLPEVQRRPGHEHLARSSANPALPRRPINATPPGAQLARQRQRVEGMRDALTERVP